MTRDLLAGTSLTPWIPPQAPTLTLSSTEAATIDRNGKRGDFLELMTSENPAWRMTRWLLASGAIPVGSINFDRVREAAAYCDEPAE